MTYQDKLQTKEWKSKRKEILSRDKNSCQRCGINRYNEIPTKAIILESSILKSFGFAEVVSNMINVSLVKIVEANTDLNIVVKNLTGLTTIDRSKNYFLIINFIKKNKNDYSFKGVKFAEAINQQMFEGQRYESFKKQYQETLVKGNFEIDKFGFFLMIAKDDEIFGKQSSPLEVHHLCYRKNTEIWNQKNEEYATLCNICHQITHQHFKIPVIDSNNVKIESLVPCKKCGGRRILSEFRHVEGGICFRCRGEGFENYI